MRGFTARPRSVRSRVLATHYLLGSRTRSAVNVPHFVGYAPRWVTLDKLYLVVGQPSALMGLRVGGQLVPLSDRQPADPRAYFKPGLASRYEGRNLLDPMLASLDSHNFLLPGAEVESARLKPRRSVLTGPVPNVGTLILRRRNGRPIRLILLGAQDHDNIVSVLAIAGVALV